MRFTLCAIGSWGDVAPFMSLGRVLVERGTDVILAAPPEFAAAAGPVTSQTPTKVPWPRNGFPSQSV